MKRRVYLYAFNDVMRVVETKFLEEEAISIRNITRLANWMKETNSEAKTIYAVDNRYGLYKEFMESVKANDFTKNIDFADIISREGILIR